MSDMDESKECLQMRSLFQQKLDEGAEPAEAARVPEIETHFSTCGSCRQWQAQTCDLISMSAAVPQFDVPEALTQRILSSVADEQKAKVSLPQMLMMILVVVGVYVFLAVDSIESLAGLLSWIIGVAAVGVLKLLLGTVDPHGKVVRH